MFLARSTDRDIETVRQAITDRVGDHDLGLIHTHDLQAAMEEKGVDFAHPCYVLEVCNPRFAKTVLEADPRVSTALPCRISLYPEDGRTVVATLLPTALLEVFSDDPVLMDVARTIEGRLSALIDEVTA